MVNKPKLMQRKKIAQRALDKIMGFVDAFIVDAPAKPNCVIELYPQYQMMDLPLAAEPEKDYE